MDNDRKVKFATQSVQICSVTACITFVIIVADLITSIDPTIRGWLCLTVTCVLTVISALWQHRLLRDRNDQSERSYLAMLRALAKPYWAQLQMRRVQGRSDSLHDMRRNLHWLEEHTRRTRQLRGQIASLPTGSDLRSRLEVELDAHLRTILPYAHWVGSEEHLRAQIRRIEDRMRRQAQSVV